MHILSKDISISLYTHAGEFPCLFKQVIPLFEILPKSDPVVLAVAAEVLGCHFEGIDEDIDICLTLLQGGCRDVVDLVDTPVGHRKTADRLTSAVDHDLTPRAAAVAIKSVGIADIERFTVAAVGIAAVFGEDIDPLGALFVPFALLGAELAGKSADRIGFCQFEAFAFGFDPEFERLLLFEDTKHYRIADFGTDFGERDGEIGLLRRGRTELESRFGARSLVGRTAKEKQKGNDQYK